MRAIVIYDSKFGNTERVAQAIAEALGDEQPVPVKRASEAGAFDLFAIDLLVVGGPTQGHGASAPLRAFIDRLPPEAVRDVRVVTFDTRLKWPRVLAGSAAKAAAKRLAQKGARVLVPPESFLVEGGEGPLAPGELDRARAWAGEVRTTPGMPVREPTVSPR